jgi:hypothetical protein
VALSRSDARLVLAADLLRARGEPFTTEQSEQACDLQKFGKAKLQ